LDFADVGVFGGVDLLEPFAQPGGLLVPPGGFLGRASRQLTGKQGGPVGAEDVDSEEPADSL